MEWGGWRTWPIKATIDFDKRANYIKYLSTLIRARIVSLCVTKDKRRRVIIPFRRVMMRLFTGNRNPVTGSMTPPLLISKRSKVNQEVRVAIRTVGQSRKEMKTRRSLSQNQLRATNTR